MGGLTICLQYKVSSMRNTKWIYIHRRWYNRVSDCVWNIWLSMSEAKKLYAQQAGLEKFSYLSGLATQLIPDQGFPDNDWNRLELMRRGGWKCWYKCHHNVSHHFGHDSHHHHHTHRKLAHTACWHTGSPVHHNQGNLMIRNIKGYTVSVFWLSEAQWEATMLWHIQDGTSLQSLGQITSKISLNNYAIANSIIFITWTNNKMNNIFKVYCKSTVYHIHPVHEILALSREWDIKT